MAEHVKEGEFGTKESVEIMDAMALTAERTMALVKEGLTVTKAISEGFNLYYAPAMQAAIKDAAEAKKELSELSFNEIEYIIAQANKNAFKVVRAVMGASKEETE